jgi:hypothetical protein
MAVFLNWVWAWLTYGRGARLITGEMTVLSAPTRPATPVASKESV